MATKKRTKERPAKKRAAKKKKAAKRPPARKVRPGFISHTELASADPEATVTWAKKALGWKFGKPMPTPAGPYHMWSFGGDMGGGVRKNNPPEMPGTVPYVEVASIGAGLDKALRAGATAILPPTEIAGGMGWIAIVAAPGGVAIGFWAQKK